MRHEGQPDLQLVIFRAAELVRAPIGHRHGHHTHEGTAQEHPNRVGLSAAASPLGQRRQFHAYPGGRQGGQARVLALRPERMPAGNGAEDRRIALPFDVLGVLGRGFLSAGLPGDCPLFVIRDLGGFRFGRGRWLAGQDSLLAGQGFLAGQGEFGLLSRRQDGLAVVGLGGDDDERRRRLCQRLAQVELRLAKRTSHQRRRANAVGDRNLFLTTGAIRCKRHDLFSGPMGILISLTRKRGQNYRPAGKMTIPGKPQRLSDTPLGGREGIRD